MIETVVVWVLLVLVVAGLFVGLAFIASSVRDFRAIVRSARPSDIMEHRRHIWQQGFKAVNLLLLSMVVTLYLFEVVPDRDLRSMLMRWLLIVVAAVIAGSTFHERIATKRIISALFRERLTDAKHLADAAANYCGMPACPLRDPVPQDSDTSGAGDGEGEGT